MMVSSPGEQVVFSFVVESTSFQRVQSWAQYAALAFTQDQMNVVSDVFYAFWHEMQMFLCYQRAVGRVNRSDVVNALGWLDLVLAEAVELVGERAWPRVVQRLERVLGESASTNPWYQDACARVQTHQQLCSQVVEYIELCCAQYQLALPQYTVAYLKGCE